MTFFFDIELFFFNMTQRIEVFFNMTQRIEILLHMNFFFCMNQELNLFFDFNMNRFFQIKNPLKELNPFELFFF